MKLIDLIQDLVENPQKLAEYKQNPTAYLEGTGVQPTQLHPAPLHTEIVTVMRMGVIKLDQGHTIDSGPVTLAEGESHVNLEGVAIQIYPLEASFLAESDSIVLTQLLPHSYVSISSDGIFFDLHMLYVSGQDDDPQVLYIKTLDQLSNPTYNYSNAHVVLEIEGYILASKRSPLSTTLGADSHYDKVTHTLVLDINAGPEGPPSDT